MKRCAVCDSGCKGKQWWNRDTGFGLCAKCYAWLKDVRGESDEEIRLNYGIAGINFFTEE